MHTLISRILSIDDDLSPFYAVIAADPLLSDIARQLRGVRAPATPTVFEALTDSIIEQQISLKAARSIENRLIRMTGQQLEHEGRIWYCYPEPAALAEVTDTGFRSCGLTIRKGEYIRDISRQIVDGDLDVEAFRAYPDTESVVSEMVKLRGIGRWTAELTILRGIHRPDAFPADDIAVRRFISRFYHGGMKVSSADARLFAERWGGYKGFAAYYLEVADLLGIHPRA
jgi:DNA-3-methyladenine glycosylase II